MSDIKAVYEACDEIAEKTAVSIRFSIDYYVITKLVKEIASYLYRLVRRNDTQGNS